MVQRNIISSCEGIEILFLSIKIKDKCTLKEASVIGSVLVKLSIPVVDSAIVLMKLAEMNYNGAVCIFLNLLIGKKYSLPKRVILCLYDKNLIGC